MRRWRVSRLRRHSADSRLFEDERSCCEGGKKGGREKREVGIRWEERGRDEKERRAEMGWPAVLCQDEKGSIYVSVCFRMRKIAREQKRARGCDGERKKERILTEVSNFLEFIFLEYTYN